MLSRTSEYALRALIHLAQHEEDWPISGSRIAAETEIPPNYLSKILGDLVRAGVLESSPGKTGGFRLKRTARQTKLYDVVAPFESFDHRRCAFGNQECGDANPCLAHKEWKKVVDAKQRFLKRNSVHDVAGGDGRQPPRKARVPSRRRGVAKSE